MHNRDTPFLQLKPGLVASYSAAETILTDGFQSGISAGNHSISTNVLPNPIRVEKLEWGDSHQAKKYDGKIDLILAADCLYPDISGRVQNCDLLAKISNFLCKR